MARRAKTAGGARAGILLAEMLLVGISVAGCAAVLGFEDFEAADGSTEGTTGGSDAEGGRGPGIGGEAGRSPASGGGESCDEDDDCSDAAMCVNGTCSDTCPAGKTFCTSRRLHQCSEEGTERVGEGEECVTAMLCEQAAEDGETDCPDPTCEADATRCGGGETALEGQTCNVGQTDWEATDLCDAGGLQCNPTTGMCFELAIDETEVTRGMYDDFLAADVDAGDQERGCAWNDSFEPDADCMSEASVCTDGCDEHPQVCVDWCDAAAYCAWRGQRLCGQIGDGALVDFDSGYADPGASEWMNACSGAGQYRYGHGNDPPETEPQDCTYAGRLDTTYAVGTRSKCASPARGYKAIHDLSGNVAEWENNCEAAVTAATAGKNDACHPRGGSFESPLDEIECAEVPSIAVPRSHAAPTIGSRCCAD